MFNENDKLIMIDIETDGLNACHNHITSIAAQEFKLHLGPINTPVHFALACDMTNRYGHMQTLYWRKENGVDKFEETLQRLYPLTGLERLRDFCLGAETQQLHLFANHPEFDIAFLQSYCRDSCFEPFWNHQNVWDLGSLIKGMGFDKKKIANDMVARPRWEHILASLFKGKEQKHNAYYDCVFQIETLRFAQYLFNS